MTTIIEPVSRVAVIGAGPAGYATVRALTLENKFNVIRVFERRDRVGGIWNLDPIPDEFPLSPLHDREPAEQQLQAPVPGWRQVAPEDITARSPIYENMDSNVGATVMSFSHAPFPGQNSAISVLRIGPDNQSRPYHVIQKYLADLFQEYHHLLSLGTTIERVEKIGSEWVVTARQPRPSPDGDIKDFWWQERFDAVVIASGHYNEGHIPDIDGLESTYRQRPGNFEHSKSYRSPDNYVDKKVVVIGGSISAADIIGDIYAITKAPLYSSQRTLNEALDAAWNLPNVIRKGQITKVFADSGSSGDRGKQPMAGSVGVVFADGSTVTGIDKIIFATGFNVSYPFLVPNPVTPSGRLDNVYEHIVKIGDPTLSFVGQVMGGLTFRVFEYQATAVARVLAGAGNLPSVAEQLAWQEERIRLKGDTQNFHEEIVPDFNPYWNRLRKIAGGPPPGASSTVLPAWKDEWAEAALTIIGLKDKWWKGISRASLERVLVQGSPNIA
ncbi:dimethylaniline monooxygenase [Ophiostoma piceae UAMH 11346]|uniref:Dimethylaniline monooxygenase n=1 Tax=Ophiostoma piceae (strain UAMH 11346) TaxID=1262450 RepID=S3C1G9_OPHP1|nr:dimethylaniline monooxygenase [Ophiostoma piceae UAMH 11346]